MKRLILLVALPAWAAVAQNPESVPETPGRRADGAVLLPNQWLLQPAGRQVTCGDFPVHIALHPGGAWAAVLHCGYGPHEIVTFDLGRRAVVARVQLESAFYGLAFSPDGSRLHASGALDEVVHSYAFADGLLADHRAVRLRPAKERGIPSGLAVASDGTVYAANLWAHSLTRLREGEEPAELLLLGQAAAPAPELAESADDPSIRKRADQLLELATGREPFPYALLLDEPRKRLYVSLWGQSAVLVIDTASFQVTARWASEEHPNEMVLSADGARLFVANANRNSVSVIDTGTGAVSETLVATLFPEAPPGNTPNSVALAPDGRRLYVANANINTVAVFDVEEPGRSRSLGFIPVGWYPTSVRVSADGKTLLVANGKGIISDSNRNGPRPGYLGERSTEEYIGSLFEGTIGFIDLPQEERFAERMADWSARALDCLPQRRGKEDPSLWEGNPVPRLVGDPSPIRYVLYVIKENRTYDQILGDLPEGNGDPSLCLFPEKITPNHHALAREFVLLDNFYVESEVSADGHEWTMGAYATDFVEKNWPLSYGHNRGGKIPYPSEGGFAIATPAGGYLWDRAWEAGVTYRSYGEWVANGSAPDAPGTAKAEALEGNFDPWFRSFDMDYPDVRRADRFLSELRRYEEEGEMPRLQIVRLPNDHTSGTSPGKPTPTAQVADNDLALGRVVEGVSQSKFWPQTAIFVVEDDAQNGSDHVDAHRTIAYVLSPYARRGSVDSTLYSTSSMLRTIELILGLQPMSQFDALATPMAACFQSEADARPYEARPVAVDLDARNPQTAWGAERSLQMDFSREDAADDLVLNEVIWRSVRGADSPMPAPRRAAFVFAEEEDDGDGEGEEEGR